MTGLHWIVPNPLWINKVCTLMFKSFRLKKFVILLVSQKEAIRETMILKM